MDKKALEALLNDMSIEEKVMQLVQIPGSEYEADAEITGIERGQVKDNVKRLAGIFAGMRDGAGSWNPPVRTSS